MKKARTSKKRKQQAHSGKIKAYSQPHHADQAQVQSLGGILSNITKLPQIIKTLVLLAPLIRAFMNSFASSDAAGPSLPTDTDESAGAEKMINPVADNGRFDMGEKLSEQIHTKGSPVLKSRKRNRRHQPLKRG